MVLLFNLVELVKAVFTVAFALIIIITSFLEIKHVRVVGLFTALHAVALLEVQVAVTADALNWIERRVRHLYRLDLPHFRAILHN